MKNLKNIVSVLSISMLMLLSINTNAQTQTGPIVINPGNSTIPTLDDIKKQFPDVYPYLNLNYMQVSSNGRVAKTSKTSAKADFFTLPAMRRGKVIGRVFSTTHGLIYIDFSNYQNQLSVTSVKPKGRPTTNLVSTQLNSRNNTYVTVQSANRGWLCGAACTIASIAIAASDGPSPLMDILAVSHQVACLANCAAND